jgi:hypothetical protein
MWQVKFADRFVTRLMTLKAAIAAVTGGLSIVKSSMIQLGMLNDLSVHASGGQLEVGTTPCALIEGAKNMNKNKTRARDEHGSGRLYDNMLHSN